MSASGSVDTDVNITINAKDNASSVVDSATKKINKNWKEMNDQQRAIRREFELNNRGLFTTARAIQSVGSMVNRAISLYNSWNIMQIRIQDANRNVTDSQMDLNQVLDEYGQDSPQFRKAVEANQKAIEDLKKAEDDAKLGTGLIVASLATDATRLITDVIPKWRALVRYMNLAKSGGSAPVPGVGGSSSTVTQSATAAATGGGTAATLRAGAQTVTRSVVRTLPLTAPIAVAGMMGEQTAGENDLPSGLDQIPITINFIVKNGKEAADKAWDTLTNLFGQ